MASQDRKKKVVKLVNKLEVIDLDAEASEEKNICPECGLEDVIMTVGHCKTCLVCGWSLCGL